MKTFKEYIELKEEAEFKEEILNEDPILIAGTILGYAVAGLIVGWGGALLVTSYIKLTSRFVNSIKRLYRKIAKKEIPEKSITNKMKELRADPTVKIQQNRIKEESSKYASDFSKVIPSIKEKDPADTIEKLKDVKLNQKVISRIVIFESTKVFGEPPLHYGNTGNECYLFIKKVLGIKIARAASTVVKKAFEEKGTDLLKGLEE